MSVTQRETSRPRPTTLKLPRKPSAPDLRNSSRTHLDGRKNAGECEIPPVPMLTTTKKGPGRGLTIDTGTRLQEAGSVLTLKSAPATRTIRRLPSLPVPLPTRPSTSSSSSNDPQHTSMAPSPSRGKRPLPSPPPTKETLPTIDTNVGPSSSLPTSCRTSKPLPTPVQKIEQGDIAALPSPDGLQPIRESGETPPPTPPKTMLQHTPSSSPSRTPKRKPEQNESPTNDMPTPKTPKKSLAQALRSKDAPTAVMLHTRMILERDQKLNSINMHVYDDNSSEVSFSADTIAEPVFKSPNGRTTVVRTPPRQSSQAPGIVSEKDQKHGADYAFVLANRILYQQTSNDGRSTLTSKWVREVKGKRYTEQNFDNVMKALRTL